jgi:hypothetical protein
MMVTEFGADGTQPLSKRERVKNLLRALLSKTTENGCTEDEAVAAAAKASELMTQYDLTYADAEEVKAEVYGKMSKQHARTSRHHDMTNLLWGSIGNLTGTKCWFSGGHVVYFGRKEDCEVAHYLLDLCINSAELEWKRFRKNRLADTSIRGRKGFMRGMAHRLQERMREMREAREATMKAATSSANALVVLKNQIVAERYAAVKKALRIRASGGTLVGVNQNSGNYAAGQAAGSRVNLTTGVGQAIQRKLK